MVLEDAEREPHDQAQIRLISTCVRVLPNQRPQRLRRDDSAYEKAMVFTSFDSQMREKDTSEYVLHSSTEVVIMMALQRQQVPTQ